MGGNKRAWRGLIGLLLVVVLVTTVAAQGRERIGWAVIDKATILEGGLEVYSSMSLFEGMTIGADGTSYDVTWYSDTAGDYLLWDQSEEALTIIGTNGQDALNIDDGNVDIADNVDIDGTLDVAGVSTLGGGADLNGYGLVMDADADTIIRSQSDDALTFTTLATGTVSVLVGSMKVGNGTPTISQTGEDLYVEGYLEVDALAYLDSATYFGGNMYATASTFYLDNASDVSIDGATANTMKLTTVATGTVQVVTGNLAVGNGTPGETHNGEDMYVEGISEFDGASYFDGAVDMDSTLAVALALTAENDLSVDDTFNIDDTAYVLTGTQTLTPTASYYQISASDAVTITLADGDAGDILILANTANINAIIADTNVRTTTGSALTLNQYDIVIFLFTGTEWYQMAAQAANS